MAHDPTLQELIVRALSGQDPRARRRLDDAAGRDPDLKRFCDELDEVVSELIGHREWRRQAPSPELTAKIRQAVIAKLPDAPPHFDTVLMDADLGRRRTLWKVLAAVLLGAVVLTFVFWNASRSRTGSPRLALGGRVAFEAKLQGEPLEGWTFLGDGSWVGNAEGSRLDAPAGSEAAAAYLKRGIRGDEALAFNLDVNAPELEPGSLVSVFFADGADGPESSFSSSARPERALLLELSGDGLVLYGPERNLLQSRPVTQSGAGYYRLRLEHLGPDVRVLVNGEVFYDGPAGRPLRGPLHPGWRVAGLQKGAFRFNSARLER